MASLQDKLQAKRYDLMVTGAKNYAAADKSDPFTFNRCMSHIHNGVAGMKYNSSLKADEPAYYDADAASEERIHIGQDGGEQKYFVTVYRNVARP